MKLNPEELVVSSFDTAAPQAEADPALATPLCPLFPTPNTACFVCPAPTSPQDGCA
jgi:hypothetical protein